MKLSVPAARAEALFASLLQPSDRPTGDQVRAVVLAEVRLLGSRGCACVVAEEFGNHPETAVARMCWCRDMVALAFPKRGAR